MTPSPLLFTLRMTARELRSSPLRFALFVLTVALGVASLLVTEVVLDVVRSGLNQEARALLSGDIEVRSRQDIPSGVEKAMSGLEKEGVVRARAIEFLSVVVAEAGTASRLCEIKAVSPEYPLYGGLQTQPAESSKFLHDGADPVPRALISSALTYLDGFKPGGRVKIGSKYFEIAGVLDVEPDRLGEGFRLGPRVMVRLRDLEGTGLLGFGSIKEVRHLLKVKETASVPVLAKKLEGVPDASKVDITTAAEGNRATRNLIERVSGFLGLAGLAILLFVSMAAASAVRIHIAERMETAAILKCLGATGRRIVQLFAFQVLVLAGVGSVLGLIAGYAARDALLPLLRGILPLDLTPTISARVLVEAFGVGTLVPLLVSIIPLLPLRRLPVNRIQLRHIVEDGEGLGRDRLETGLTVSLFLIAALWLLRRAEESTLSLHMLAYFATAAVALLLIARGLVTGLRRLPRRGPFVLRQGLSSLHAPGNQTALIIVFLGLGTFLTAIIQLIRGQIVEDFLQSLPPDAANVFVIDVQASHRDEVLAFMKERGAEPREVVPLVRSRLTALDGKTVEELYPDPAERPWFVRRDYVISDRDYLTVGERILAGSFWGERADPGVEISLEDRTADRLKVGIGSSITVEIEGLPVTGKVTSLRKVSWSSMRPNFFMLFSPKLIGKAPRTYFAVTRIPEAERRQKFQTELVTRFPNLTVIDATVALELLEKIFGRVAQAMSILGLVFMLGGCFVLVGALLMTRHHRKHERAVFKCLGASHATLRALLLIEYLALGSIAGFFGSLLASGAVWFLADQVLEITPVLRFGHVLTSTALTAALTATVGLIASSGTITPRPLSLLRSE